MNNNGLLKWENLLAQLDIDLQAFGIPLKYPGNLLRLNESQLIDLAERAGFDFPRDCIATLNEDQLNFFELTTGLILPLEYREYCQVFGPGRFGLNGFCIECPSIQNIEGHLGSGESIIGACKNPYVDGGFTEAQELLDNAYLLGTGSDDVALVFDLRTYSEQDQSYDMYAVSSDWGYTGAIDFLGRDFFGLIEDICIEHSFEEKFPELQIGLPLDIHKDHPNYADYKSTNFIPFPIFANLP